MSGQRLLIFDFDGTLADTFPGIVDALNQARERLGYAAANQDSIRSWIGYGLRYFMECAVPEEERTGATVDHMTATYKELYRELAFDRARLFDGIPEVLDAVSGDVLALVSNKSVEQLEPMVEQLGIRERFSVVVGGNSLAKPKPDRMVYEHVVQVTGGDSRDGWMIGDSEPDIELGKNAGLGTVACLWGMRTRSELERTGADHLVGTAAELQAVLTR